MRGQDGLPLLGCMVFALSGCMGSPGSIRYDTSVRNAGGTIALSDPKLYSRETLITERTRDLAWLDKLIEDSADPTKVVFKPSLYREIEIVSVLSAQAGLKFDPTAAITNQRANALGEIKQEYDELALRMELESLRARAVVLQNQWAKLTEVTDTTGSPADPGAMTPVGAPDATPLLTAINSTVASLTARLDAESKPIGKTEALSSPIEDFQDRLAYRNMLKAARNAAGWDELHDAGNNRLIRLNFQATVFPDPENARALGAVQLRISNGNPSDKYLFDWLRWVNTSEPWRTPAGIQSSTIDGLIETGDFEIAKYPSPGGASITPVLLPFLTDESGVDVSPDDLRKAAEWTLPVDTDRAQFDAMLGQLSLDTAPATLAGFCAAQGATPLTGLLRRAQAREQSYSLIKLVNLVYTDLKLAVPATSIGDKYEKAVESHRSILGAMATVPSCAWLSARYPIASDLPWKLRREAPFSTSEHVRIYEIGPREQVQQVSTVARSANSLALAASIAGSAPQAGIGASLGAGFRRDMMTRASALERVPEVVGYSVAGQRTFGWVIGPRATTNGRGRTEVEQLLKPYDLSVDLSIPSWWTQMDLQVVTAWAPSPRMLVDGSLTVEAGSKADEQGGPAGVRTIAVPLPAVAADHQAFTQFLLKDSSRPVEITGVVGGPVNACASTTLIVNGRNLWRADRVVLLGTSLGRDAISIASDMQGIIVTVPAIAAIPGERSYAKDPDLHVFTPLGQVSHAISYEFSPSGDACKPKPAADASAPTVTGVAPASIVVPSTISLDVTGTNLASVETVKLGRQKGVIALPRPADGKSLTIIFDDKATSGIDVGVVKLEFFAKDGKSVGTPQDVRVSRSRR